MRLVVHTVFIVLLFVAHMFALGIYGFAVGLHELWRAWSRRTSLDETFVRFSALAIPSVLLAALMIAVNGSVGGSGNVWAFGNKATWILHTQRIQHGCVGGRRARTDLPVRCARAPGRVAA